MQAKMLYSDLLPVFYNVSAHVGPGRPNQNDDVLLVQFLLKKCGELYSDFSSFRALSVDGVFGPKTAAAIVAFQTAEKKRRPTIVVDGVVSPQRGSSPSYGAIWSICQLNKYVKDKHLNKWPRMQDIPGCPALLKQKCFQQIVGRTTL